MIKIFTGKDDSENYYLHSLLEAQGVRATILGEYLAAAKGRLPFTEDTMTAVWVHPEDIEQASQIVNEYNDSAISLSEDSGEATEPWVCPACENQIEAQFTQCWNCQMKRTESSGNDDQGS